MRTWNNFPCCLQKKKGKKDKEKKTGATGPPAVVSETPPISAKNLQEILQKLSVDEKQQAHDFWDSQPVPKLGMCPTTDIFL